MNIYINRQQQNYGPYTDHVLAEWIKTGQISPADLAWCEGQSWQPLGVLLQGLGYGQAHNVPPPPPPPSASYYTPTRSNPYPFYVDTDATVKRIATYEKVSGYFWIALGILQCLLVVSVIAGIWNIFAGISRIRAAGDIEQRSPDVPAMFEGVGQLIIIGLINLFLGGIIGVVCVGLDFYVRSLVLSNRHLFEPNPAPDTAEQPVSTMPSIAAPVAP